MLRNTPPKHRHDGTSPLPLGMDWSPPPRRWNGRDSIWPHDFHTGWSYCITIPSWVVLPKARDSDPVVFYRVQIGLQSPEGMTTMRGILRRFNDFMKLFSDLKKLFPKNNLPAAPPKGLLRMKSRALLEERRYTLEQWMTKLLSDIDVSRSVAVASFLELEAAARSAFQDVDPNFPETNPPSGSSTSSSLQLHPSSSLSIVTGNSSIMSDYGSDTAYEISELGTPRIGRDANSEVGTEDLNLILDEDLPSPIEKLVKYGITNIDEGLLMGQTILDQLEGFNSHKLNARWGNNFASKDAITNNGLAAKATFFSSTDGIENLPEPDHGKVSAHARKSSTESVGSDISSFKGSDMSNSGILNSLTNGSFDHVGGDEFSRAIETVGNKELQAGDTLVLPLGDQHKLNRVLTTMQQRLVTAKTDMEDLIARLNQEIAVKDYLLTKVKDLEVELETSKQKSKENMQQAILNERDRVTQMQWDMEELRRRSLEMELKLKSAAVHEEVHSEQMEVFTAQEKDILMQELEATKGQLKKREELEVKSKSDIKVLVKEVKSLRNSQADLKQQLSQSLKEKTEAEKCFQEEKQRSEHAKSALARLLCDCTILRNQLQECNIDILQDDENDITSRYPSQSDALELLKTSDSQVDLLLAEAKLLAGEENSGHLLVQGNENSAPSCKIYEINGCATITDDCREMREILRLILLDNAGLRKRVNSVTRGALKLQAMSTNSNAESPT